MRPLICAFSKISKSEIKHQRCWCGWVGLTDFFQISMVVNIDSQHRQQGQKWKSVGNSVIQMFSFPMSDWSMDRGDFFYPNRYGEMPRTFYHEDLSQEAPFWHSLSAEQRTTKSHLPLSYIRSFLVSASISSESQGSLCTSNSDDSPDTISASRTEQQGKKFYEKWSKKEKAPGPALSWHFSQPGEQGCSESLGVHS